MVSFLFLRLDYCRFVCSELSYKKLFKTITILFLNLTILMKINKVE